VQVQNSMHEVNGTTAIDLGGGDLIVLNGVTAAQLQASDFILTGGTSTSMPTTLAVEVASQAAASPPAINLASLDGITGFHMAGISSGGFAGRAAAIVGDLNGDGFADFLINADNATANGKSSAGEAYVVFGHGGSFAPNLDLSTLNGSNGFRIPGSVANGHLGTAVAGVGDMNGDGLDDLVVTTVSTSGVGAGPAYVIFGRSSGYDAAFDLATLDGHTGFAMNGSTNGAWAEAAAASADINHDGFSDLILGARYDVFGNDVNGSTYVVFGHAGSFTPTFPTSALNGTNGFRMGGVSYAQGLGSSVSSAGDINGDGIKDLVTVGQGKAYIVFGHTGSFGASFNLTSLNGSNGFVLLPDDSTGGATVSSVGDINGDGYDDLLIGAVNTSFAGQSAGGAYILFGHAGAFSATVSTSTFNGVNGFRIDGLTAFDNLGQAIAPAGDFNSDGLQDFIIGARYADPNGLQNGGASYVIYGRAGGYAPTLNLAALDGTDGFRIDGVIAQGQSGTALAGGGDINGDGYDDIIVTVPNEPNGALTNAGGAYVIFGHATPPNTIVTGTSGNDVLMGHDGNDRIDGLAGADRLYGGLGDDTYYADRADDLVFENAGEGTDTVIASAGYYLYANSEKLTLAAGAGDIFGVGNDLANVITGNEGSNLLIAGAGADVVHGGAGVDSLFGQDGSDQLFGDAGIDYLVGGDGNDALDGGTSADALYGEAGNDVLTGGTDFQTDILVGGDGNDVLHGDSSLGDYDRMDGGAGDDSFYVDTGDDLTFEAANGGTDTVYANVAGANNGVYLYANVENLVLLGTTTFGVGNELANHLTGNASGNYLLGGAGDDVLNGKAGNDVLFGQAGADTFIFEHGAGGDVVGDFAAGTDKIDLTAIGYTWQQVQNSLHENGGNTAIDLGGGDLVVLNGVTAAQLQASDFILSGSASAMAAPAAAQSDQGYQIALDTLFAAHDTGNAAPADIHPAFAHAFMLDCNDGGMIPVAFAESLVPIDTSGALMA
jgi:Ca2+-binding RTX toxin-like protein